jgi:HSP20 family protein
MLFIPDLNLNKMLNKKLEDKIMIPSVRNRLFLPSWVDDFFGKDFLPDFTGSTTGINTPAVNIIEGKEDFRIEVAAPGLGKNDFKLSIEHNLLTISSEKEEEKKENGDKFMRREFCYSCFRRSFSIPDSVDSENISASHKDGILTLTLPKKEQAKAKGPRQILIA